jgi:hypothetical protein
VTASGPLQLYKTNKKAKKPKKRAVFIRKTVPDGFSESKTPFFPAFSGSNPLIAPFSGIKKSARKGAPGSMGRPALPADLCTFYNSC